MRTRVPAASLLALLLACTGVARGEMFRAVVERVTDGDTLWVRPLDTPPGAPPLKLRIAGIDAPERCQPHGAAAGRVLRERLRGREVTVDRRGLDAWERSVARVSLDGGDVGAWLVAEGHAWSYGRHPRADRPGGPYAREQRAARAAGRGLFADPAPMPPWVFRAAHGPCD